MREKLNRKWLAVALAIMMTFAGVMPASVFAEPGSAVPEVSEPGILSEGLAAEPEQAGTEPAAEVMPALDPSDDVDVIVSKMSLRQKITQCFMMDFETWNGQDMTVLDPDVADIIADYQFGAVILFWGNVQDTGKTLDLTKAMQSAVMSSDGLPLLIATDQEGGAVFRLGSGTALPGNMAVTATGDTENARISGRIIGSELRSVGINTTMAPVLDVNVNANNPIIGIRSFSDEPDIVWTYGKAYLDGLGENHTIGCAKHFPGHGDTDVDSHTGLPMVDKPLSELEKTELKPFRAAIDNGADMIMTAHIIYPQVDSSTIVGEETGETVMRPATISKKFLTDIIRGEMNYNGVVVTDAMNMKGVSTHLSEEQAALEALKAGADLICMPVTRIKGERYDKETVEARLDSVILRIESACMRGELSEDRLNEAVTRVLTLKKNHGILDYNEDDYSKEDAYRTVGSAEHRQLEKTMADKAVTLIRNDDYTLPYDGSNGSRILLLSPYKSESAQMVMGFNRAKKAGNLPSDAEVRVFSFQNYFENHKEVIEGELKEDLDWADLVIIGSELYSADDMAFEKEHWLSLVPLAATEYCRSTGKKSVIMSMNTPYDVQLYPDADAVIAVYGCAISSVDVNEAIEKGITESDKACGPNIIAGVEAIFGVFDVSGKLPVNVPVFDTASKTYTDKIIYARGYGLTYDRNTYSIVYKLNGGSYNGSSADITEAYKAGTYITVHEEPVREGYEFLYWKGSEYQPGDKYRVTDDHVFTAQWKKSSGTSGSNKTNTGDDNLLEIWLVLLLISLTGLAGAAALRRRRTGRS